MLGLFARAKSTVGAGASLEPAANIVPVTGLRPGTRVRSEAIIRKMCQSAYLGDHMVLCRALGRYKMYVDSRDVGIAPHLMLDGYWEMWVTEALVSLVRSGMVVADIGANLGYFSLLLADLVGAGGQVHAFEPNPRMTELLQRSASINGFTNRIQIHQVALGAENEGEVALIVPKDDPKNAHIVPIDETLPGDAVRVPVVRLDGRPDWRAIEFAKIDVEGAEQLVWAGAQGLLDSGRLKIVVLEFTAARYPDPQAFLSMLTASGFSLAHIDLTRGVVDITPSQIMERDPTVDIMLVLRR